MDDHNSILKIGKLVQAVIVYLNDFNEEDYGVVEIVDYSRKSNINNEEHLEGIIEVGD